MKSDLRSLGMKMAMINRHTRSILAIFAITGIPLSAHAQQAAAEKAPAGPAAAGPSLVAGSDVPSIDLQGIEWIKGEPVTSLDEEGKVYMIECWATWCGPCIASIPHINELHAKFADKGLIVVGMNVFEDGLEKVKAFTDKQGDKMAYRVAYSGGRGSEFAKKWLDAAGVKGIPHAFFVKNGKLLFTSHPAQVDEELVTKLLSDDFDPVAFAAEQKAEEERMREIQAKIGPMMQAKDWAGVKEFANTELTGEKDKKMKDQLLKMVETQEIQAKIGPMMQAKDWAGIKEFVNSELADEKDKEMRNRILRMVAMSEGDWAAIQAFVEAAESDDERDMIFGQAAFQGKDGEGSAEAAKAALKVFSEEKLAEAESIEDRLMPGLIRARYLSISGDKDGASALLKSLAEEAEASQNESFKSQVKPILDKAIAATEAGTLGPINSLMR